MALPGMEVKGKGFMQTYCLRDKREVLSLPYRYSTSYYICLHASYAKPGTELASCAIPATRVLRKVWY
eukprot:3930829-Rhodomonas_salina.2